MGKLALEFLGAGAAVVSAVAAIFAWQSAETLHKDTLYVETVNTRITTCTALSEFHKGLTPGPEQVTAQLKPVSAPSERSAKEASMARALTLCLVDVETTAEIRACVTAANDDPNHKVHDMLSPATDGLPPNGKNVIVC